MALVLCPKCHGSRDVHPTPYATAPCDTCDGNGMVDNDGTSDPTIRDAPTLTRCPSCEHCHGCGGTGMVTQERAAWIRAGIKGQS